MLAPEDRDRVRRHGVTVEEVERQIDLFENPLRPTVLDRPCTVGDGIRVLDREQIQACERAHTEACRAGRLRKFVPASGAATRMFKSLLRFHDETAPIARPEAEKRAAAGDADSAELVQFLDGLPRFAFFEDLRRRAGEIPSDLREAAPIRRILRALLDDEGLGYGKLPKGLLLFHRYPDGPRTAFEEHLVEAAAYVRAEDGNSRLHFTVSPEHLERFRAVLEASRPRYEAAYQARFEVTFSLQKPSTDTIAVDLENRPFRAAGGDLLFRPGGHGALIENLNDLRADVILIKNIDNVVPDRLKVVPNRWKRILAGYLVSLQERVHAHLRRLRSGDKDVAAAARLVTQELGLEAPPDERDPRAFLVRSLARPIRVCGMVRNTGEPGGGPFWVRNCNGGVSLQIVESAQVDSESEEQGKVFASSTHFNPVDMVCGVRDEQGRCYDLTRFVDSSAVFISEKSYDGRRLKALERPGLWNGGMADWITVFVEMPLDGFAPVKTVNDLLRPEHQP